MTIRAVRRVMPTGVDVLRLRVGFDELGDPAPAIFTEEGLPFGRLEAGDIVLCSAISITESFGDMHLEISDAYVISAWLGATNASGGPLTYPIVDPNPAMPFFTEPVTVSARSSARRAAPHPIRFRPPARSRPSSSSSAGTWSRREAGAAPGSSIPSQRVPVTRPGSAAAPLAPPSKLQCLRTPSA